MYVSGTEGVYISAGTDVTASPVADVENRSTLSANESTRIASARSSSAGISTSALASTTTSLARELSSSGTRAYVSKAESITASEERSEMSAATIRKTTNREIIKVGIHIV